MSIPTIILLSFCVAYLHYNSKHFYVQIFLYNCERRITFLYVIYEFQDQICKNNFHELYLNGSFNINFNLMPLRYSILALQFKKLV